MWPFGRHHRADPDFEHLLLSRHVRVREELEHAARERFDVGVVAVVHAALLADAIVQVRHRRAVLAQPGAGHVHRVAERDRRGAGVLGDDVDVMRGRHLADLRCQRGQQRDRFNSGDRAEHRMPVRRAFEKSVLQPFLAQLFLVVGTQVQGQRVDLGGLQAIEVFLAEARIAQLRYRMSSMSWMRPIVVCW